jgi:hypothetical protein
MLLLRALVLAARFLRHGGFATGVYLIEYVAAAGLDANQGLLVLACAYWETRLNWTPNSVGG